MQIYGVINRLSYDLIIIKAVRLSENTIRNAFEYYVIID